MTESIFQFIQSFRIQDFFDIIIISSLIYVVLIWFKKTASRFVFVGISLMGVVYILARIFNLYLTSMVLQGFFAILLIALVVIFQEDIRRFFERLATWRSRRMNTKRNNREFHPNTVAILTETVADFAARRTGALIVLSGRDPLERHLRGGHPLEGILSKPLLESIFDKHSLGHDGAVIIKNEQVLKFGCHLPLSLKSDKFEDHGLRHTAAMGLSERSDALCIVVSEERGTISVVRDGDIRRLKNAAELTSVIEKFYEEDSPADVSRFPSYWVQKNSLEKAVAILLALGLWFVFGFQKEFIQRDFLIPIEYRNISQEWEIEETRDKIATVTFSGPTQAFNLFDPSTVKISIDLSSINEGKQEILLTPSMMRFPSNLSVVRMQPDRITISAYRLFPVDVPVHVKTTGKLPEDFALRSVISVPEKIPVLAPGKMLNGKVVISTEPIDISSLTATQTLDVKITYPPEVRFRNRIVPLVRVTLQVERVSAEASE
ncbi:MAG: diadenylate cyclase [Desulfomonilia bacterium]|nr:diadenylate cyclase [Desulfomonilia bacterium]